MSHVEPCQFLDCIIQCLKTQKLRHRLLEIGLSLGWKVENNCNEPKRNEPISRKLCSLLNTGWWPESKNSDLSRTVKAVWLIIGLWKMLQVSTGDTVVRCLVQSQGGTECIVYVVKWAGNLELCYWHAYYYYYSWVCECAELPNLLYV